MYGYRVTAKGCRASAGFLYGLPEMPIRDVQLNQVHIEMTTDAEELGDEPDMVFEKIIMAGDGMLCKHVEDLAFNGVGLKRGKVLLFCWKMRETLNCGISK